MYDFMGIFFILSAALKLINLTEFAREYRKYDLIARQSTAYAYAYPFIELSLGVAYLIGWNIYLVNWVTLIIMLINTAGVGYALYKKQDTHCACLGHLMRVPISIFSLIENFLMAGMAAWMIVR
jgi:prepilin signal peptidase PulO-like enzyme (type II secretory pathway)